MKTFFTSYKDPVAVLLAIVLAAGIFSYTRIKTSLFPEVTFPKVKIIADVGEQPIDKMMVTVTRPMEDAIKRVPGLTVIRSTTSRGSCEISAFLEWGTDVVSAQQMIESSINRIRSLLPPDVEINVERMNPSILPVMSFTLEGKDKSAIELTQLANYTVRPFLSQVEGVAGVPVVGGKTKEYWVIPDPQKMASLGITPAAVSSAITESNDLISNGYQEEYNRLYLTVTDLGLYSSRDIGNVIVSNNGKRPVQLKDIARIEVREQIEYTKINANGKGAVLVGVLRQPEANVVDLSDQVREKVTELNKVLPKGVVLRPYYVQADFVNDAIRSVSDSLWIGLVLAIIVAVLFLRSFKASLTILVTIPITLSLSLTVMHAFGYTFNIMTLGAIAAAIGLIIDDAIVVVEQIHRTHEEHPEETSRALVGKAIHFLFPAMLGSSLSTIVIFVPFVLMGGVAGAYFNVLTNTMIITLVCSFIVTWVGLPVVYLLLSRDKKRKPKHRPPHEMKKQGWVLSFTQRPWISMVLILVLVASIFIVYPNLETGFLPEMDEGTIVLDYKSPPGTSLAETDRILRQIEKQIAAHPDVANYSRRTGTEMGFFITEQNNGDYLIQLKKDRNKTTDEVIEDLRESIETTQPALEVEFGQVIGDMLGDLISTPEPIEVKVFGNDPEKLNELARQVGTLVEDVQGAADVFNGVVIAGPSVEIRPDLYKLSQYGITPADLQMQLQAQSEGVVLGTVRDKEQLTNVRFIYDPARRAGLEHLEQRWIVLPGGRLKPLSEFAEISIHPGVAEIQRENQQSMAVVTARLDNRDLGSAISEIQQKIRSGIHLPPGYYVEYGGAYAEQQRSFSDLLMILIIASLLVFAVILFLFRDIRAALIVLMVSVLGVSGSFIFLLLTGTPLNVSSYTGIIMIVGIIGENAIFTFQQFRHVRLTSSADEAIVFSISTRLRPKLMTALGAIIALTPIALGIGAGAQMHQPLAIAVIGGFLIALPLLLIVLPTMLRLVYSKSYWGKLPSNDELDN